MKARVCFVIKSLSICYLSLVRRSAPLYTHSPTSGASGSFSRALRHEPHRCWNESLGARL